MRRYFAAAVFAFLPGLALGADQRAALDAMRRANAYFMREWADPGREIVTNRARPSNIWTRGVYYEGLMALYGIDHDPADLQYAVAWGDAHHWGLRTGPHTRSADDQCCGQTYLDLYQIDPQPQRIAAIRSSLEAMIASPGREDWFWIDAIQMSLPAFAKLGVVTHNPAAFTTAHELFLAARDGRGRIPPLYNPKDHLWYRDRSFVPPFHTAAGKPCYWSRGNGWVFLAMARALEILPPDAAGSDDYAAMLRDMATAAVATQRPDGFWNPDLGDPADHGGKESSGTALFVAGLAAGIRLHVLPEAPCRAAAERGWQALTREALHPDGMLGFVQGTGKAPDEGQPVTYDHRPDFDDFGVGCFLLAGAEICRLPATALPREWVDPATHHRVIRLSDEAGTESLYFNLNPYTPDGKKLIVTTPHGIATIDLATRAIHLAVPADEDHRLNVIGVGRKTGRVFYVLRTGETSDIYAADLDSGRSEKLAAIPAHGQVAAINADETVAAGTATEGADPRGGYGGGRRGGGRSAAAPGPDGRQLTYAEQKEVMLNRRLEAHLPMRLFALDLRSGGERTLVRGTDWLNHLQFSPTDPALLMYCHEGPWHKVDRIWLVRTDQAGAEPKKVHARTMNMEIAGHEWWAADGQSVWYDLQTPRGEDFWVAGYQLADGARTWFHLQRDQWSVHFNRSPDGKLFAGDGGDAEMVAHAPNGKWIYLFTPKRIPDVAGISAPDAKSLIRPGVFEWERLVDMSRHDYRLEPNVSFTPDMKGIVFRSNLLGPVHVFEVELARATERAAR